MRQGFRWLSVALLALVGIGAVTGAYAGWVHLQAAAVASGLMLGAGLAVFVTVKFTNQADPATVLVSYAASVSIRGLFGLGVTSPPPWNDPPAPMRSDAAAVRTTSGPPMQ